MPKQTKVLDIRKLRPADHIAIWDRSRLIAYMHHGIVFQSGEDEDAILIVHVWSPFENTAEAQADSHWRVSTLRDFLYKRTVKDLRRVQYNTSGLLDVMSRWGEVHMSKSDIPEVVLARCRFLMGMGKGNFNIFTQNCEHAAHWCKTGTQWSKQLLIRRSSKIPFTKDWEPDRIHALSKDITFLKYTAEEEGRSMMEMNGTEVVIRVDGSNVLVREGDKFYAVPIAQCPKGVAAKFRLQCWQKGYHCIEVSFSDTLDESKSLYCRPFTDATSRTVELTSRRCCRAANGFRYELTSHGDLVCLRQHRRYLSLSSDGTLIDVPNRDLASQFELITWDVWASELPLPQSIIVEDEAVPLTPMTETPRSSGIIQNLGKALTGISSRFYAGLPRLPFISRKNVAVYRTASDRSTQLSTPTNRIVVGKEVGGKMREASGVEPTVGATTFFPPLDIEKPVVNILKYDNCGQESVAGGPSIVIQL